MTKKVSMYTRLYIPQNQQKEWSNSFDCKMILQTGLICCTVYSAESSACALNKQGGLKYVPASVNVYFCERVSHSTAAHGQRARISAIAWNNTNPGLKITQIVEVPRETWTDKQKEVRETEGKGKAGHLVKKTNPSGAKTPGWGQRYSNFCHLNWRVVQSSPNLFN